MEPEKQIQTQVQTQLPNRVLSIQSHVVHGYVGNKSAVFPLQLLGIEVDFINTVHFSNHTGYPIVKGTIMDGDTLQEIVKGMDANGLIQHSHLLTGYIGSESLLHTIVKVLELLKEKNSDVRYVCDPVLGDHDKLYTKEELVQIFRDRIIPLADIITPNHFEMELLTETKIKTEKDILKAFTLLHSKGPRTIILTSFYDDDNSTVQVFASTTIPQNEGYLSNFKITIPKLAAHFTGSGDLTAALVLAWCTKYPFCLQTAIQKCMSSVFHILKATAEAGKFPAVKTTIETPELKLIQNQHAIINPEHILNIEPIEV